MGLNVLRQLKHGSTAISLRYMLTAGLAIGLAGCSYWPAVRESYGQRVRILDGAVAVPAKLVMVQAKVMKLRYPHRGWIATAPPDMDGDSEISTPTNANCNANVNNEPDGDDGPYINTRIFVTAMAYLKIIRGQIPHHASARYIDLDFGNDQIMEYYLTVGRIVTLRFTPGGRLYDIPHAPP